MAKDCKPWARLFPLRKASPEPSELLPPPLPLEELEPLTLDLSLAGFPD